jgi:hypothetical protein
MANDEPGGDLQFEQAEFGQSVSQPLCSSCGKAIWSAYYAIDQRVVCESCKARIEAAGEGSRLGRFLRAALFGLGAALVGAGVWYGVRAITGYELGIIAIGVGVGVGTAVRTGARGRGGWRYQALAMFLTYTSVVSTYVPEVWSELMKRQEAPESTAAAAAASPSPASVPVSTAAATTPEPVAEAPKKDEPPPSLGTAVAALGLVALIVFGIAFAAPFLGGAQNLMGLVIIGIALYEAWKINRKMAASITGPYRVGPGQPEASPAPAPEA